MSAHAAEVSHIMVVATECETGREDEFHEWYEQVHIPDLLAIPGIRSAQRYRSTREDGSNRWLAIYELVDDPAEVDRRIAATSMFRSPAYLRERTVSTTYAVLPPAGSGPSVP